MTESSASPIASELPPALASPTRSSRLLLEGRTPARLAWVGPTATPRLAPMWFEFTGVELLLSTFSGARKVSDLAVNPDVTISLDTESFPYRSLRIGGTATLEHTDGLTDSYRRCASRYLGPELAARWCDELGSASQVLIRVRPSWASGSDMGPGDFLARSDDPSHRG
ncbi:MAG: pyridoxamine 5'-phosphate oxidase family protein [Actinomycetota bacterium]